MAAGPEYVQVEEPLIRQLEGMGWRHLEGAPPGALVPNDPGRSGRESFSEVFLLGRLRAALRTLNGGPDGGPWLDERRVAQAVGALTRIGAASLVEANRQATELLLNGTTVEGLPGWDGGRDQQVHFIDWEHPERNDFVVISQFRLDIPGTQGKRYVVPDEVLFVNGIPLAVVECKKPGTDAAIAETIKQFHRYADRRGASTPEGNAKLFHTIQLTVATCGDRARLGTLTSDAEHYQPWRDPYPMSRDELAQRLGKHPRAVNAQDVLAGVVLDPYRLLDIVHNYVSFMQVDGRTVKIAPRYPQYRAVARAVERLLTGRTKAQDGYADRRGGIIWHTQGSGKSLTMTFLVRKLRATPALAATKVVVVTDRKDLQRQLAETAQLTGEVVQIAKKVSRAKTLLGQRGPGLVFVMIQKQQDVEARRTSGEGDEELSERRAPSLGVLNTDESVLTLIDEAHRSHGSTLHANLLEALPNCARIGFTGTPIIMGKKKKTSDIFGEYIDTYRLADAEADGAVVPILYQGRTVKGAVREGRELDEVFEDMFDLAPEDLEELQRRYATKGHVLEAEKLVASKAKNMLRHYVGTVLPNGLKAQLVAHSREATVRYQTALIAARDELVGEVERLPGHVLHADLEDLDRRTAFLARAHARLDLLKAIDFVPVISPGTANDEEQYTEWTDERKQEQRIDAFKQPFPTGLAEGERPIAFLIVKSMLLTGFDARVEQVLYVDRSLKEAELLQAVARVNRLAERKTCGYVVDYYGVANHLAEALKAYAADDIEGTLKDLRDEIAKLEPQRRRLRALFTERGVTPDPGEEAKEACVVLLEDEQVRDRFEVELKRFLTTVDTVLPLPDARPYLADARLFAEVQMRARRRYRIDDGEFDANLYGEKVRELIDEYLESLGVEQILPPVSLTAKDFREKVDALASPRAKASEMEHAIRHHIDVHFPEDPTRYKRLSQRLEEILRQHREDWEQQVLALGDLLTEMEDDTPRDTGGLNPVEHALYGLLLEETATDGVVDEATGKRLGDLARWVYALAAEEIHRVDFWRRPVDQANLTKQIATALVAGAVCELDQVTPVADKLFEVIKANRRRIPRP